MSQKKHKPEEIAWKLRQGDVLVSQRQSVAEAMQSSGVTPFTFCRWRIDDLHWQWPRVA